MTSLLCVGSWRRHRTGPLPRGRTGIAPGRPLAFVGTLFALSGISGAPTPLPVPSPVLERYDFSPGAGLRRELPWALEEVSGLAVTLDGRLFAHNDERAVVYQIDPETGGVLKAFSAGYRGIPGDFEGIAVARGRFALVTSAGLILELPEGEAGSAVEYHVHRTRLGHFCEIEGLAFDPMEDEFLLPCKVTRARDLRGHLVVISVPLDTMQPYLVPRVFLPLEDLREHGLDPSFHPSAIEVLPDDGTLILAAAREGALVELTSQGRLLAARKLSLEDHPQAEGLTFLPDGTLVLADEGRGRRGRITLYPPVPTPGGGPS
jgi:hypothetical protein